MKKTPERRRAELEQAIADLRSRIAELDARSGEQSTFATSMEIEREVGSLYEQIHHCRIELRLLEDAEKVEKVAPSGGSGFAVGLVVTVGLFALSIAAGSWAVMILAASAAVWTVVGLGSSLPQR